MQIKVSEVKEKDIIDDGKYDSVIVTTVYPAQPGLGVVIKGESVDDGTAYFHRFLNPETLVTKVGQKP